LVADSEVRGKGVSGDTGLADVIECADRTTGYVATDAGVGDAE